MNRLRVLAWWLAFAVARGALWLAVRLLLWPMRLLEWLADWRDMAEVGWLLACTGRRLADRRRLNGVEHLVEPVEVSEVCHDGR